MCRKIIDWNLHSLVIHELKNMLPEQIRFKRIGVIEVNFSPLVGRQATQVFVIRVVLEICDSIRTDPVENCLGNRCLARPRSAGNADDQWCSVAHASDYSP